MEKLINEKNIIKDKINFRLDYFVRLYKEGIFNYSQIINMLQGFLITLDDFHIVEYEETLKIQQEFLEKIS